MWQALAAIFAFTMASVMTSGHAMPPPQAPIGVFANAGEKTFEQAYRVKLNLPMPEDEFLALVEKLELRFGGQGPESVQIRHREYGELSPAYPRLVNYNLSTISHSYRVYGGINWWRLRTETYLALVNSKRMVVYVESQFDYAGFLP